MTYEWIRRGLTGPGKTQRGLAAALAIDPSGVSRLLSGQRDLKASEVAVIAAYLGITAPRRLSDDVLGDDARAADGAANTPASNTSAGDAWPEAAPAEDARAVEIPATATMTRDVEVRGTAVGGDDAWFDFNGEVVDYVRRPPGLSGAHKAFAIYVAGTSMAPRYDEGELVFVHPGRPAVSGSDVVVELHGHDGEPGQCYLKRMVRKTASKLVLAQFNPAKEIEIELARVRCLYRVLTAAELLGV